MNAMRKTYLPLSDKDKDYLKSLSKKRTIQAQVVDRAKILLYKADGMTFQEIADKLTISTATVRLCISKFNKGGVDAAIFDVQRSGRPSEITDDAKAWMISIACQKPTELGYAQEFWTLTALHKYIQKHAEEAGYPRLSTVTKPYIQKFLKEQDIKPFKIKYYCEKRDPDFESKMHEVLLVYKQIEMQFDENGTLIVPDDYKLTITVSYDEKPGIQAISNTAPDLRPTTGHGEVYLLTSHVFPTQRHHKLFDDVESLFTTCSLRMLKFPLSFLNCPLWLVIIPDFRVPFFLHIADLILLICYRIVLSIYEVSPHFQLSSNQSSSYS